MRMHKDRTRGLAGLLLLLGTAACDNLLDVRNPGSVEADDLDNPTLAQTQVNSALGRFECAYVNYVLTVATSGGELINASNWAGINPFARRNEGLLNNVGDCPDARDNTTFGAYAPLHQARYLAEDGARRIEAFPDAEVPQKANLLGQLAAYAGYATQLLGEGWCEMAFDQGPIQTREQAFARAEERFTTAIGHATTARNDNLRRMALVGRARARLNKGDLAGAAADAAQIPEGFVWNAEYSTVTGMRENRIFNAHNRLRYVTVNYFEYGNLRVGDVADTRVPVQNTGGFGQSGGVPMWAQQKYRAADSPIPIASWEEAQLILAEARPTEAVAAINRLRRKAGLPAYTGSGSIADVLEERRRQLFLEGHRFNDKLRHRIPFPTGRDHQDQQIGPYTCLPLPRDERDNNPSITGGS